MVDLGTKRWKQTGQTHQWYNWGQKQESDSSEDFYRVLLKFNDTPPWWNYNGSDNMRKLSPLTCSCEGLSSVQAWGQSSFSQLSHSVRSCKFNICTSVLPLIVFIGVYYSMRYTPSGNCQS